MAGLLPPTPVGVPPGHSFWNDWYEKLRYLVNNTTVVFSDLNFTGSNLTSIATRNHNDLQNIQGGAANDWYHLTNAQATDLTDGNDSTAHFHSADRARANHTGTQTTSTISDISSGTYTPTITGVANVSATTALTCQYVRVGSVVTVSGKLGVDPTAAGGTNFRITLPVASNFGAEEDCGGTGLNANGTGFWGIRGDSANDAAFFEGTTSNTANQSVFFHFTYRII